MSDIRGNATILRPGLNCVIRMMSQGAVCGFASTVLECERKPPYPYALFRWPDELEALNIRQDERLTLSLPCTLEAPTLDPTPGELLDISANGCRVLTTLELLPGSRCTATFVLPDATAIENLTAIVRNRQDFSDGRRAYGLHFPDRETAAVSDVAFYVMSTLERMRGRKDQAPRLLLCSPQTDSFKAWASALSDAGFDVVWASNAIDSFSRMKLVPVNAVIVGESLPGITGIDLCRIIRSTTGFEQFPIFVVTSDPASDKEPAPATGFLPLDASPHHVHSLLTKHILI